MSSSSKDRDSGTIGSPLRTQHADLPNAGGPSEHGAPSQTGRRRAVGYLIAAMILSWIAGVAVVRFNPLFAFRCSSEDSA